MPEGNFIKFRKHEWLTNATKRVYCIYCTIPKPGDDFGQYSKYGMNSKKIKDFFNKSECFEDTYQMNHLEKANFRKLSLLGDLMSFTVMSESG